ncbi:hypothetical protein [Mesorhizobium sp. AA23]|uniref:hypothetical protein n=1 Tax=Mesorhizobium sp. AA23 TaxID=1854058 RepID=UPI0007FF65FC|nr:hypothetical protein [Mesorhizobium sp. AA23]OBQ90015.1 hypothetical protein A9K66_15325 [Mesorhizobium sp. AA23]
MITLNLWELLKAQTPDDREIAETLNVTLSGHPLESDYVVRYATTNANGQTVLHNEGEGTGLLQSSAGPVAGFNNNQQQGNPRGSSTN